MQKVIITGYTAKNQGVILETNIPAKLKTGNVKGKDVFVSWDKIGRLLFEEYTELSDVASLDSIRNNSSLKEEVEKQYGTRLLKDDKFQVIDQHENNHFQGTEMECLQWIDLKGRDFVS